MLGWTEWTSEPLIHNALNAVTRGIWRLTADRPVILKVLTGSDEGRPGWESSHDPRHWNYWRREAEVYAEGLPCLWKGSGLREAGWRGDERLVRLAVCASAIKYDWLVPAMLRAVDREQLDYGGARPVEAARRYRERGQTMMFLAGWADEARRLAETL